MLIIINYYLLSINNTILNLKLPDSYYEKNVLCVFLINNRQWHLEHNNCSTI